MLLPIIIAIGHIRYLGLTQFDTEIEQKSGRFVVWNAGIPLFHEVPRSKGDAGIRICVSLRDIVIQKGTSEQFDIEDTGSETGTFMSADNSEVVSRAPSGIGHPPDIGKAHLAEDNQAEPGMMEPSQANNAKKNNKKRNRQSRGTPNGDRRKAGKGPHGSSVALNSAAAVAPTVLS